MLWMYNVLYKKLWIDRFEILVDLIVVLIYFDYCTIVL